MLAIMVVMLAFVAFAFDMGNIVRVRTELQRSADAAALAGAWQLIDEGLLTGDTATVILTGLPNQPFKLKKGPSGWVITAYPRSL